MLHFRHETCGFSLLNHVSANKNTFPFSAVFSKVRSYQKNVGRKTGNKNHEKIRSRENPIKNFISDIELVNKKCNISVRNVAFFYLLTIYTLYIQPFWDITVDV